MRFTIVGVTYGTELLYLIYTAVFDSHEVYCYGNRTDASIKANLISIGSVQVDKSLFPINLRVLPQQDPEQVALQSFLRRETDE